MKRIACVVLRGVGHRHQLSRDDGEGPSMVAGYAYDHMARVHGDGTAGVQAVATALLLAAKGQRIR